MIAVLILVLILLSIQDILYFEISDIYIILIIILALFKIILNKENILNVYTSMAIYSLPLFVIWLIEVHIKKELIGLADIKLMLSIGFYLNNTDILNVYIFYTNIVFLSLIVIIIWKILKKKDKYIFLAPMISIATIIEILNIESLKYFFIK